MTRAWRMWALAAAFYLVAIFHRMSLGVAALDAGERFGVSTSAIALLSTIQLAVYLAMQIPAGLLADRLGPRRSLTLGLLAMGSGELLFALSPTLAPAVAGRALVGAGDACIFLNVLRVAAHWLPPRRYALAAALTAAVGAFGQLLSTAPLSAALSDLGWTPTFAASGILTAILAVVAINLVQDRPAGTDAATAVGGSTGAAGASGATTSAGGAALTSSATTSAAGAALTSSATTTAGGDGGGHESIGVMLRNAWRAPATRHGLWVHFALMAPFVTLTGLWAFPYLVTDQQLGRGAAAALLAAAVLAFGLAAPVLGALAGRQPSRRAPLTSAAAATVALSLAVLIFWPGGHPPVECIAAVLCLCGAGGAASMLAFDLAREGSPHAAGSVSGMVNIGGFGAAILAQSAIGVLVAAHLDYRLALTPLVILAAYGALQATRHGSLRASWSSSRA